MNPHFSQNEELLRQFIEYAPVAIAMFDRQMQYLAVSDRWKTDYGLDDNVIGKSHYELFPELPERWKLIHQRGMAGEIINNEEDRFERFDGTVQWIRWEVKPWHTSDDVVGGIIIFAEDITQRKIIEEELRSSEENFRSFFENIAVGTAQIDSKGKFIKVNDRYCVITGYSREELCGGMIPEDLDHPDDRALDHERIINFLRGKAVYNVEKRYIRKNGEIIWVHVSVAAVRNNDGSIKNTAAIIEDISERKRYEEAIVKERNLSNEVIDSIPGLFYLFNRQGNYLLWSRSLETITGYTAEEIRLLHPLELIQESDRDLVFRSINIVFEKGQVTVEASLLKKNKQTIPYLFTGNKIIYEGQQCLIGEGLDTSQIKIAEAALRESEERFRYAQHLTKIGTWDWNLDKNKVFWSEEIMHIFGISSVEFGGTFKDVASKIHPKDVNRWIKELRNCIEKGNVFKYDFRIIRPDGGVRWLAAFGDAERDKNGKATRMLGMVMDITERKVVEEKLRESETKFSLFMEYLPGYAYIKNSMRQHLYINAPLAEFFGKEISECLGKTFEELIPITGSQLIRSNDEKVLKSNIPLQVEEPVMLDGEKRTYLSTKFPIHRDGNTINLGGISVDITDRKIATEQLESSLHEKDALLQEIYHRTKNNMQVISSMLELQAASSENEELHKMVHDSTTRIRTMALAHEKIYKGKNLSQINMKEYLSELAFLTVSSNDIFSERVKLHLDLEEIYVLIDIAIPCGLIVNELLTNIYKHAFPGERKGNIEIKLHKISDHQLLLIVSDNGVGLPHGFDIMKAQTLGIQLILQIARHQLKAETTAESNHGLRWCLQFRDDLYKERVGG